MKHFVFFIAVVFSLLFLAVVNRNDDRSSMGTPTLRVFAYSSFTNKWGPGPLLKAAFEKTCECKVEFIEGSDSGILLQRLKIEGESLGADLVIGLDQFDLDKAQSEQQWRKISTEELKVYPQVRSALGQKYFIPYDWGVLTFVGHSTKERKPQSLDELLDPLYEGKIALQDPRTSSPGLQFVAWVLKLKGEEEGFRYLAKMMKQAHSFSPTWSSSYGLFTGGQARMVYSYITSPLYHQVEEKNHGYMALTLNEPLPIQYEFVGIPEFCRRCELSEKFINLMLSDEGQKILMTKNYMFPVKEGVADHTDYAPLMNVKVFDHFEVPSSEEVDRILRKWSDIRRGDQP